MKTKARALSYAYKKTERALRRELLDKLALPDTPEPLKNQYRDQLQELRDGARTRAKRKHAPKPDAVLVHEIDISPPVREQSDTDDSWKKKMLLYRLNVREAAAQTVLNDSKNKGRLTRLRRALDELYRVEEKKRRHFPEMFNDEEDEDETPAANSATSDPASVDFVVDAEYESQCRRRKFTDITKLSDEELRAENAKQRHLHEHNSSLFSHSRWQQLFHERRRRNLPLPDVFGNLPGERRSPSRIQECEAPTKLVKDSVPAAKEPESEPKRQYTPTTAQKEARLHWKNQFGSYQDFPEDDLLESPKPAPPPPAPPKPAPLDKSYCYRLSDGALIWSDGTKVNAESPRLSYTRVLGVKDPPNYQGNGIIEGWVLDVSLLLFREA